MLPLRMLLVIIQIALVAEAVGELPSALWQPFAAEPIPGRAELGVCEFEVRAGILPCDDFQ